MRELCEDRRRFDWSSAVPGVLRGVGGLIGRRSARMCVRILEGLIGKEECPGYSRVVGGLVGEEESREL